MKIYIDNEHKCHTVNNGDYTEVETDFFEGKCSEFIEGHKYYNDTIFAWKPYSQLALAQSAADRVQAEADEEIATLLDTIEELIIGG